MNSIDAIDQALEAAIRSWQGCDWDTEFGDRRANLNGLRSRQATLAARATRGSEAAFWRDAARFLERVERDARLAAQWATSAVNSRKLGDVELALEQFQQAIKLEAVYRQPLAYPPLLAWLADDQNRPPGI